MALIITIIILLILTGVTLSITLGENGIFSQSKIATQKYENEKQKEEQELQNTENEITNLGIASSRDVTLTQDQYQDLLNRIDNLEKSNQKLNTIGTIYENSSSNVSATGNTSNVIVSLTLSKGKYVIIGDILYKGSDLRYYISLKLKRSPVSIELISSSAYDKNGNVSMAVPYILDINTDSETIIVTLWPGKDVTVDGKIRAIKIGNID